MDRELLIPVDFRSLNSKNRTIEGEVVLTDEEMKTFPHFISIQELRYEFSLSGNDPYYGGILYIWGTVTVLDNHSLKPETIDFDNEEEYTFDLLDSDNSSFEPARDGNYYLRDQILISLDDAVPRNFSLYPSSTIEVDGVNVVSENEWEEEQRKMRNPFYGIDDSDFEDGDVTSGNEENQESEEDEDTSSYYLEKYGESFFEGFEDDEESGDIEEPEEPKE